MSSRYSGGGSRKLGTGASGEILMEGLLLASTTALLPWVSLIALAGTPLAVRAAE